MTEKNIFLYKLPPPAESGPLNLEGGGGGAHYEITNKY